MGPEVILALIGTVIPIINNGISFLAQMKKVAAQNAEWTDEQRAAVLAAINKLELDPEEWQKVQPL